MSDPISPSPRSFEFPNLSDRQFEKRPEVLPGILKKPKAEGKPAKAKLKRVTIEEVPDEEDDGPFHFETFPPDSRVILDIVEPIPSVPSTTFSSILEFDDDKGRPRPNNFFIPPDRQGSEQQWDSLESSDVKDKHVRWKPSVISNRTPSPGASFFPGDELLSALAGLDGADQSFPPTPKSRSRANSLVSNETERKGKGKERSLESEDMGWYMTSGFDPSKRLRSNPASAM